MKVLHLRLDSPGYNSDGIEAAFKAKGFEYESMKWQNIFFSVRSEGLNRAVLDQVRRTNADLIFAHIQKDGVISTETLKELSEITKVVFYTFDVRKNNDWYKDMAPYVAHIFFADQDTVSEFKRNDINNVSYLASSANYDWYKRLNDLMPTNDFGEIVFIGNNFKNTNLDFEKSEERAEMVDFLQRTFGDRFKVYGMNWKYSKHIHPQEEVLIYNSSKVAVTHNNFYRRGYQSDRTWRAMGCGIYTVAQYYPDMNKDFNATHLSAWLNFDMLATEIEKAFDKEDLRKSIAAAGGHHVRLNHSWENRIDQMMKILNQK